MTVTKSDGETFVGAEAVSLYGLHDCGASEDDQEWQLVTDLSWADGYKRTEKRVICGNCCAEKTEEHSVRYDRGGPK